MARRTPLDGLVALTRRRGMALVMRKWRPRSRRTAAFDVLCRHGEGSNATGSRHHTKRLSPYCFVQISPIVSSLKHWETPHGAALSESRSGQREERRTLGSRASSGAKHSSTNAAPMSWNVSIEASPEDRATLITPPYFRVMSRNVSSQAARRGRFKAPAPAKYRRCGLHDLSHPGRWVPHAGAAAVAKFAVRCFSCEFLWICSARHPVRAGIGGFRTALLEAAVTVGQLALFKVGRV